MLTLVEAHAEGEVGRVITGGVVEVRGADMAAKMAYLNGAGDDLRRFCVFEPRGYAQMSTNLLCAPTRADADAGFIVLQSDKAHAMSGSNAMCVATVLLETGMVEMKEPETILRLDTAAGLVVARAECRDGKCERVFLDMTPAFVEQLDVEVDVPAWGKISVDIAFGGVYYAFINPRDLGLEIIPEQARALVDAGCLIHRALQKIVTVRHPEIPSIDSLAYVMFVDTKPDGELVGATILPPGRIDRSPCGTGNAARMAVRHARGEAAVGATASARSITGGRFDVESYAHSAVATKPAILTRVSGRAWIYGMHQIGIDPADPYPQGYLLADCWGEAFDLLR